MRFRLRVLLALLVAAPLAGLAALGLYAARSEEARTEREVRALLERKLDDVAATIAGSVSALERRLLADTEQLPADPEALRVLARTRPRLRRMLVLDARGRLRFPPPQGPASEDERRLVADSRELWERGVLAQPPRDEATGRSAVSGWQAAAAGTDALGLVFWRSQPDGGRVALFLPGVSVTELLVAPLPVTGPRAGAGERMALQDPAGRIVYQWGTFVPPPGARPLVARALDPPVAGWRLAYLGPAPARGRASAGIAAGLATLAVAIVGAGLWLYRESTRDLRLASQRVSFVNQVSHELKTPLTNIRLYAELLEDHVATDDDVGRQRLDVVVSESQRLGRLIHNILTFSRKEKGRLALHRTPASIDDVVGDVIAQFAPGLAARGIEVTFTAGAPARVLCDADAVSQMLGNVLGNVEKYAPHAPVEIATATAGGAPLTTITVTDGGTGIPPAERERIFQPFVRLESPGHEGIAGTGIGLGIARDLARLHGGDLRVLPVTRPGACFEITLHTEAVP